MDVGKLESLANSLRVSVVKMLTEAGSGHSAGALGSADFWTVLYFGEVIRFRPLDPWWEERDRVILSAGHYAPILYAVLAEAGFFPKEELSKLRVLGSRLQGHPVAKTLPGIENSSGSLGQGVSQAVGMAIAAKIKEEKWRVVCFMGDGEQNEGQVWEAYMTAVKYNLDNLTLVIDCNNIQLSGFTNEVMPMGRLVDKLTSFGLNVYEINGHDHDEIKVALEKAKTCFGKPTVIVLQTVPGKGVLYMENEPKWHGQSPNINQAVEALSELRKLRTMGGRLNND